MWDSNELFGSGRIQIRNTGKKLIRLAVNLLITIIDKSSPYLQLTAGIVNSASRMAQLPNVLERTTFAAENFMLNTHH